MDSQRNRDIVGGGILIVLGLATLVFSLSSYQMGTLQRMGPGLFSAALGTLLAVFGVMIAVAAVVKAPLDRDSLPEFELRPVASITLAAAVYALTIGRFGLVAAVFLTSVIASYADEKASLAATLMLAACLVVLSYLVFSVGLDMHIRLFPRFG